MGENANDEETQPEGKHREGVCRAQQVLVALGPLG